MSREDAARRRENAEIRRQEQEERTSQREEARRIREEERRIREEERRLRAEEKENEQILNAVPRREKKVTGVMMDTSLKKQDTHLKTVFWKVFRWVHLKHTGYMLKMEEKICSIR